jgi:hypothetical protein
MFGFLREWNTRRIVRLHPIPEIRWQQSLGAIPILQSLSPEETARLRTLATLFLCRKSFVTAGDFVLAPWMCDIIAIQACYPILNLGFSWLDGWRTVIVHPGRFLRRRCEIDDIGVMHEWTDVLRGESWQRGPVVFSWADVAGSGLGDGYNVIIHEIAHKLDMLNRHADGFPPIHRSMPVRAWTRAFTDAYQALKADLQRGEDTVIDSYAAESPAEYFAVLSEYFFERPQPIHARYPQVYQQLAEFYRQDPYARLSNLQRQCL